MRHSVRAHSKFSASGSERWISCPGSVELSEGLPDKSSPWAKEGTDGHEALEAYTLIELSGNDGAVLQEQSPRLSGKPREMLQYAAEASTFLTRLYRNNPHSDILVETRIHLDFIHPDMFGTFDACIADHFGTLHIFDYKYGIHAVSPVENLQLIFYGLGMAHQFKWNFKRVRLWIIQPRVRGYDGPTYWDIPISELKRYVDFFRTAVRRVEEEPDTFVEGNWCHFCKAKSICPLKAETKLEEAKQLWSIGV